MKNNLITFKMKQTYLKMMLIITLMFATATSYSQSGAVYNFSFRVDPELTNYGKIEFHRKWFSEFSEGDAMPLELIDSIKIKTEEAFTNKLKMPVKLCYYKNKKGEDIGSVGTFGELEGLPSNTFKGGKKDCPQNSHYIKLDVQLYPSGGSSITMVTTKTKLKPKLQITARVVDENNNDVWKKEAVLKDFAKLRSETRYYEGFDITTSEVFSPIDIYAIYLMGLDMLMKEE